jgi:hypothetical protein
VNNEQRPTFTVLFEFGSKVIDWYIYIQVETERENNFVVFGSFFLFWSIIIVILVRASV